MARAISQLSPKAQQVYRDNPDLAAKRAQQVGGPPASANSAPDPVINLPSPSLPDFVKDPLLIAFVLVLGLVVYGRYVRPINLGLGGFARPSAPSVDTALAQASSLRPSAPARVAVINPVKFA